MSRKCEFSECRCYADFVFFVPRGTSLGIESMVCADINRVDIDTILDTWDSGEYPPYYIGQCATYLCSEHRRFASQVLEEQARLQWR